ncbi:MAG TPA: hypothetical protein VGN95_21035 [Pyrinomonadaceae bacterium]|jgi:hypothetical protein|nr:hypothetical protein [Pyrinomonadaceae bacterium]
MDEKLINAYAYSNLQRALLTTLLADILRKEKEPAKSLQEYYGSARHHLKTAEFPPEDPDAEKIRQESLNLAQRFFRDVEVLLLSEGTLSESSLII